MLSTTIRAAGSASLKRSAASSACLSSGLRMLGTPSRTSVPLTGSMRTSLVSGTCLTQTMIFIGSLT